MSEDKFIKKYGNLDIYLNEEGYFKCEVLAGKSTTVLQDKTLEGLIRKLTKQSAEGIELIYLGLYGVEKVKAVPDKNRWRELDTGKLIDKYATLYLYNEDAFNALRDSFERESKEGSLRREICEGLRKVANF